MSDPYKFWRAALAGKPMPAIVDNPQPGFYARKLFPGATKGQWPAVIAIWRGEDGEMTARTDRGVRYQPFEIDPLEVWNWCCVWPIPEAHYRARIANEPWPSDPWEFYPKAPPRGRLRSRGLCLVIEKMAAKLLKEFDGLTGTEFARAHGHDCDVDAETARWIADWFRAYAEAKGEMR